MTLKLVETIYDTNAADIPAMMRQAADNIETETPEHDRTKSVIAVQVTHDGVISIYGWGAVDRLSCIGALQSAVTKLCDVVEENPI